MKVFDDVITLWNPGELPENFTVETLLTVHESRPRNQLIARAFYLAGFIESWGRGYEKIRDQFAAMQLAMPTFELVRGGMMTTIIREKAKSIMGTNHIANETKVDPISDTTNVPLKSIVKLTERQSVIVELLRVNVPLNVPLNATKMSNMLNVSRKTIQRDLEELKNMGLITKLGSRKDGYWVLTNQ